jgi:CheY-like chemotaxis protein
MLLLPLVQRAVRGNPDDMPDTLRLGRSPARRTRSSSCCASLQPGGCIEDPELTRVRERLSVCTALGPRSIAVELGPAHDAVHDALRNQLPTRPHAGADMATALVAEDEATLRQQLVEQLGQLWPELSIVGEAANGVQALRLLDEQRPDVLFLDIQMPGATGLEVARQASGRCHVVFVTAYDQHAVAAFDQGAVDYVLKPVSAARLFTAVTRLKQRLGAPPARLESTLDRIAPRRSRRPANSICAGSTRRWART